jgi:KUP system potassium uptake protein
MQAVQAGCSPRLTIRHTSADAMGQIYLPLVNWGLMLSCVALVLGFGSSSNLAAAYGVSITATMLITTVLFYVVARWSWNWKPWIANTLCGLFLVIDLAFLTANLLKIFHGGWFPLAVAAAIFALMSTWNRGRKTLAEKLAKQALPLELLLDDIRRNHPTRVSGTAVFMTGNPAGTPTALLHNLKHNKVLHERILIVNVRTEEIPHVPPGERGAIEPVDLGFWRATLRFGFMEEPNVPEALEALATDDFPVAIQQMTFFLGREKVLCASGRRMRWRESLFAWMSQNARDASSYFNLPPNRVVELGAQIAI